MRKEQKIVVKGNEITILSHLNTEYISLTDMVKGFGDENMIYSWMRNRNTLEFIGIWEEMNNPDFKGHEFVTFKTQAGLNTFNLTSRKWIEATNAIGIISKAGRYGGGTFAHRDIAFEFGTWISPEFKLYLIKEFQRLKAEESDRLNVKWNLQRTLAMINYHIHTEAIKEILIPKEISKKVASLLYDQLVVLTNLESLNAVLIEQGLSSSDRLLQLNKIAINQLKILLNNSSMKRLR